MAVLWQRFRSCLRGGGRRLAVDEALVIAQASDLAHGGDGEHLSVAWRGWRRLIIVKDFYSARIVIDRRSGEVIEHRQFPR